MIDYDIFRQVLEARLFALEMLREWQWNPLEYNVSEALYLLIARESTPFDTRMRNLTGRLRALPAVVSAARTNLVAPPMIHTQTAILQNEGSLTLLRETLQPFVDSLRGPLRDSLITAREAAIALLQTYGHWLRTDLLQRASGDFSIGPDLYRRKFALRLDTEMKPEQLLAKAEALMEETTEEMDRLSTELFPAFFPDRSIPGNRDRRIRAVLARLSEDFPSDSTIVAQAERDLREAEAFVRDRRLVTVPTDVLDIIVMPEFQRGVAVAYCDSPGPLEKNGKTFFAISPTPGGWTQLQKESFYREYNDHMLKNLVVHEAMPGHFLQLVTANSVAAPTLLRSVFPSGVFAEGWATYCEQLMADAGYGGAGMKMQQLKMYLRLLINAIIDQGIHASGMTRQQGMRLMMERGFQEEGEASGKWRRACLTSVQLSTYFYGNLMMRELRTRSQAQQGTEFSLAEFHDQVLSHGTISPKYLPMLMKLPAYPEAVASR
jgi:hypothetical protein